MLKIRQILLLFLLLMPGQSRAVSLGIVSDIHAGSKKLMSEGRTSWYYPSHYCDNLEKVKKSEVDYILTLGDNTLNGRESEAKKIIDCLSGYDVLWTKGNHDKEVAWKHFNTPNYYSKDLGKWKIIVLDSSKIDPGGSGGFRPRQLAWLEKELLSDQNIVIGMHHHIFKYKKLFSEFFSTNAIFYNFSYPIETAKAYPEYSLFKHMIETSGNVKYVYSGHIHGRNQCQLINKINYCSVPALSLANSEGYFSKLVLE